MSFRKRKPQRHNDETHNAERTACNGRRGRSLALYLALSARRHSGRAFGKLVVIVCTPLSGSYCLLQ